MKTTTELTQSKLVKKFHTLLSKYRIGNDAKAEMLWSYGVESSLDLTVDQLLNLCEQIEKNHVSTGSENQHQLDLQRKRLIASIFAWRASLGAPADMNLVKATACRAAKVPEGYALSIRFNSISAAKLKSLYNAFTKAAKDVSTVEDMTQEMIDKLTTLN
jgi:hypothetical protein